MAGVAGRKHRPYFILIVRAASISLPAKNEKMNPRKTKNDVK